MAASKDKELTVYLDHLIRRESLRYQKKSPGALIPSRQRNPWLSLKDLWPESPNAGALPPVLQLRKPDFQRATLSWTPEDCVLLLESFINRMVVPSIVMWTNPSSSFQYILDGAHRVSVVMAWLSDDWGDKEAPSAAKNPKRARAFQEAAKETRNLIKARIGYVSDFRADYDEFQRTESRDEDPAGMGETRLKRALFYKDYIIGQIGFPVVWVEGDHDLAERSFLRINKSGKRLSPWETRVIEYRNSSAMRVIMSVVSTPENVEHYWPKEPNDSASAAVVESIHAGVETLRHALLSPSVNRPFKPEPQPLVWTANESEIPDYLGELLCVLAEHRGTEAEIIDMLARDNNAGTARSASTVINNGSDLIKQSLSRLAHVRGMSTYAAKPQQYQNQSLGIVPILYLYTARGDYVRSLLYGFLYWMLAGSRDDVLARKRAFCCYRPELEAILLSRKADVVGLNRKTGSGSDVTAQTARYFDETTRLLVDHHGQRQAPAFKSAYAKLVQQLVGKVTTEEEPGDGPQAGSSARTFTTKQKYVRAYTDYVASLPRCGICQGYYTPGDDVQHDHVVDYAHGGGTASANQQIVHPFCNNPDTKTLILSVRAGKQQPKMPDFVTK